MRTTRTGSVRPLAVIALLSVAACDRGDGTSAGEKTLAANTNTVQRQTIVNVPGTAIQLTARRMSTSLRDGTPAPMWGFCRTGTCTGTWAPGPTLLATAGTSLEIDLTNELPVPTSLVILGQLGGGLGAPAKMPSPAHPGQNATTFPTNAAVNPAGAPPAFLPPAQGDRVRSFGAEVAPAAPAQALVWSNLRPGTYLYETGTLPSLQVPMGLYGVLVVTAGPGVGYPGLNIDDEATLLFSEMDPVQNAAVDAAAVAGADLQRRFNDPACTPRSPCYPAAVNYAPTYFYINGRSFDPAAPEASAQRLGDHLAYGSGNVLVRLLNAGSRTHVPTLLDLPMALVAEDGHLAPGRPKVQNEVLLTAGKTHDVLVRPPSSVDGLSYAAGTFPVIDRSLSLSTGNRPGGGMQAYLLVNHAAAATQLVDVHGVPTLVPVPDAPGNLPSAIVPVARADSFNVPYNAAITGDVTANDVGVTRVTLGAGPAQGTLSLRPDGSFTFTPTTGFTGDDTFTYLGNGSASLAAVVTLHVGAMGVGPAPVAAPDTYASAIAGRLIVSRPGVLGNDRDPSGYPLHAGTVADSTCGAVSLHADGSFEVTGTPPACAFTYLATNSQGTPSAPASVTINFGTPSNLQVAVLDAQHPATAITDYRWTLQEDLTFKPAVGGTPPVSTRSLATSFHRSHMPVVATGCVGPVSCGSGQSVLDGATGARATVTDAEALARQVTLDQVVLDPTRRYYVSILPGDAGSPPGHIMGGAEVTPRTNGGWAPLRILLQQSPLVPAQLSIFLYEDHAPTNGQNEPGERPLGGFNVVLSDPAGRTGDVAGQQTFDAFNMPLSNALLGRPGCPDELNVATNGSGSGPDGHLVGAIYTCPNDPHEGTPAANPAKYALAGHALVKNLTPARYDVVAHPGAARDAAGEVWWQTETLEGTAAQDAFTGINEPSYFQEFGPPGPHVTIGFVSPGSVAAFAAGQGLTGTHTITGRVTSQHMSHPSDVTLWDSDAYDLLSSTTCQVVLNSQGGDGPAIAAARCDQDGNFTLAGVPAGTFEVAIFDQWLDQIIQAVAVTVPSGTATVTMGNRPVLSWFNQYDQNIYLDLNQNGVYDEGEPGLGNVPLTVRYRNGAPSNSTLTDSSGNGLLAELFPLFNWYVAEADTTRFKQTGVHILVDGGGRTDTTGAGAGLWASHYATGEPSERTELPGATAYGFQGFISQRNRVDWGRTPYATGENGGIVGNVVYSSTRPFDDMRLNVQTIWEPLVPRVAVNLYRQETLADGTRTLALIDTTTTSSWDDTVNLVNGADAQAYLLGPDGRLRVPSTGAEAPAAAYPAGTQVNLQCPGQLPTDPFVAYTLGATDRQRCYDGWHAWNQVQAAPYDGRYAFPSAAYVAAHPLTAAQQARGQTLVSLPAGTYVVEAVTPAGYQVVKEEDKNILIGDAFVAPATQQFGALSSIFILPDQATLNNANPNNPNTGDPGFQSDPTTDLGIPDVTTGTLFPACVGNLHRVPDFLSLYPQAQQVAPFAGMDRPLCDRKEVVLGDQMQSAANFFIFTEVPVASNNTGIILDDASSEFNAAAPDFGEKASVPFVPVSIKDFTGLEVGRTYSDQWGAYNMMTPSSWLVNPPTPSGYGPNMLVTCMNDPGPIADPSGALDPATGQPRLVTDPAYSPLYSTFCYTSPFMPGQTTYLDTPVVPIAAFAGGYNPPDCAQPTNAPVIARVDSSAGFGPWLPASGGTLTILAEGDRQVLNPAYAGPFAASGLASQRTLTRHYGFGVTRGQVKIGAVDLSANTTWRDDRLVVRVPANTPSGELTLTTAGGQSSVDAVTVTVGGGAPTRVTSGGSIQDAIDAADPGALILIDAGTYNELVVMWKPVRLQGVGASAVLINAAKFPTSKLENWRPRINALFSVDPVTGNQTGTPQVDPLPTQEITGGTVVLEPTVLGAEEGAGITVLAKNLSARSCRRGAISSFGHAVTDSNFRCQPSRIDGLSVTGGDSGGGIYVNGWAHGLEISNNRVYGNAGAFHGGIRVGVPGLELQTLPTDGEGEVRLGAGGRIAGLGFDVGVKIHHNAITRNGTVEGAAVSGGAGAGISICAGTDGYSVDHNYVCGNFGSADGAGIGHLGFSQDGRIAFNQVLFNQSFQQTGSTHGGGIAVLGEPPVAGPVTLGTGDVTLDANLIRGNFAEGGQGGGVRLQQVNGADVTAFNQPARWHRVALTNNIIVNNVAGWAGGGVSLSDTLRATIVDNTIADNDSTGIAGVALVAGVGRPAPAGLVSEPTSAQLLAQLPNRAQRTANAISQPVALFDNIVWKNRSFYYSGTGRLCVGNSVAAVGGACTVLGDQASSGQCVNGARYWDLGVLGDTSPNPGAQQLNPSFSVLTSTQGYTRPGNTRVDPGFVGETCNGARVTPELGTVINPPSVLTLQVAATVDEGNNYVNLRYGPLYVENPTTGARFGDFHLGSARSSAVNTGVGPLPSLPDYDFDNQPRPHPRNGLWDIGADEYVP